jgi:hypothetical protein
MGDVSWEDFLDDAVVRVVPWVGGPVRLGARAWRYDAAPAHHGWHRFALSGRRAQLVEMDVAPEVEILKWRVGGYLVGDRLVPDDARGRLHSWPKVHLLTPTDLFARVMAGRVAEDAPLVYVQPAFPLGPEEEARCAFEDRRALTAKGVTPALAFAFTFAERLRAEEDALHAAQRRAQGDGRRTLAVHDFGAAATQALALSGARYLSHRPEGDEYVVRFEFVGRRFTCVVNATLGVVSAGICLTAAYDDETFAAGTKGDTWLTLESLPAVIRAADASGVLVQVNHGL